jgi:hypothetical protein
VIENFLENLKITLKVFMEGRASRPPFGLQLLCKFRTCGLQSKTEVDRSSNGTWGSSAHLLVAKLAKRGRKIFMENYLK